MTKNGLGSSNLMSTQSRLIKDSYLTLTPNFDLFFLLYLLLLQIRLSNLLHRKNGKLNPENMCENDQNKTASLLRIEKEPTLLKLKLSIVASFCRFI